jgi:hypothetical protein
LRNAAHVTVEDGTWGLVRASSNKPELVVVVESPVPQARMREMFKSVDAVLRTHKQSAPIIRRFSEAALRLVSLNSGHVSH